MATAPDAPRPSSRPHRAAGSSPHLARLLVLCALSVLCILTTGCDRAVRTAFSLVTDPPGRLPAAREVHDLPYVDGEEADAKHRYDLFLPAADEGWPTVVFVHGGGWTSGDRDLAYGDFEVYGAIGRRLALEDIGAAVISYRLQPDVTWREQVHDVARAVAAASAEVASRGGDPRRVFLSGHSAGAQLATYVGVRGEMLTAAGAAYGVCGIASISGAGYDLADARTYELGAQRSYYEERFATGDGWQREASAVTWLDADDPPMLLLFGRDEWPSLQYQNRLLADRLGALGIGHRLLDVPHTGHRRMVLEASDPGEPVLPALIDFVRETDCSVSGASAQSSPASSDASSSVSMSRASDSASSSGT